MSYPLLLQRCINTPLLMEEAKLQILTSEVFLKLLANEPIDRSNSTPKNKDVTVKERISVIPVYGSLVNKNGAGASAVTSYQGIRTSIMKVLDAGATTIGFDFSTSGGEASGNFPLADFIYSLPGKYGVRTFGFTDSIAASGGYSLLAATQQVFATDMATVGSIGAVATLADTTKMDEKMGVAYEILRSRDSKQIYNPHEGISAKARATTLTQIKAWDDKFFTSLLKYRPQLTTETLSKLDGGTVTAIEGLSIGLVDTIVSSIDEVFPLVMENSKTVLNTKKGNITMATQEETLTKLVEAQDELASLKASMDIKLKSATKAEQERCLKILEAKDTFGLSNEVAVNAISKGFSLDIVTSMFTEIKASLDASSAVETVGANAGSQTPTSHANLQKQITEKGFEAEVSAGLDALKSSPSLFGGMN